jgi:plasmid stabilization system protein ParE
MTLRVRPEAHADILEAAQWYEERQQGLGIAFVHEVDRALLRIDQGPERYAISYRNLRRIIVRRFPYAIYYAPEAGGTVVVGVLHQSRDRKALDERRSW